MPASVITISEFAGMSAQIEGTQVVPLPVILDQVVTVGATSTKSNAFSATTRLIRIHAKASCCIVVANPVLNPTATVNNLSLALNQTEYLRVNPGDQLAVIADP